MSVAGGRVAGMSDPNIMDDRLGIRPGDELHTECRDGVAFVECAWPGEITNPGGPAIQLAWPGDTIRVGPSNWRVSDRTRVPSAAQTANSMDTRYRYVSAIMMMTPGPYLRAYRRAEVRQMLVDLMDAVEQDSDEAPIIAALEAFDRVAQSSAGKPYPDATGVDVSGVVSLAESFLAGGDSEPLRGSTTTQLARGVLKLAAERLAMLTLAEATIIKEWIDDGIVDPDDRSGMIAAIDRVTAP